MLGLASPDEALLSRPAVIANVDDTTWNDIERAWLTSVHTNLFRAAWDNGRAFFSASGALHRRAPAIVEWKGPHKPPGYDSLPADLRVDHVYLVSCKYGSDISANSSPSNLFDRLLADRARGAEPWYAQVAPEAYVVFYQSVRRQLGGDVLPALPDQLRNPDLQFIRAACQRAWPEPLQAPWRQFSMAVAAATAERWRERLSTKAAQELMLWRLLRLETAPYFVLGTAKDGTPMRYRVATPWDWRQHFELRQFGVSAIEAGQPLVRWEAVVRRRSTGATAVVRGDVEVRWSHGRFSAVEAKLHLKTPVLEVPGYFPID